eukprot:CAMPEP_0206552260 /NCGR_PEP_ID=MMETSP0325_2-20121206/15987_1 /ASSEMBLY_ACC=CAM_ASM_000347 /TAXON_ID=2866 /ORGANISM="Crypthecodinium cohnii, Strain Seligo" /LENGTH=129 /DNA_ID=CAMNT_0054052125 /DNA_START=172 /DNA_END=561 /DNA_ORIENTATION=+
MLQSGSGKTRKTWTLLPYTPPRQQQRQQQQQQHMRARTLCYWAEALQACSEEFVGNCAVRRRETETQATAKIWLHKLGRTTQTQATRRPGRYTNKTQHTGSISDQLHHFIIGQFVPGSPSGISSGRPRS